MTTKLDSIVMHLMRNLAVQQCGFRPVNLHFLLYIANGWEIALRGRNLALGPVLVTSKGPRFQDSERLTEGKIQELSRPKVVAEGSDVRFLMNPRTAELVPKIYGSLDVDSLENVVMGPGTPWDESLAFGLEVVPDEWIANYFSKDTSFWLSSLDREATDTSSQTSQKPNNVIHFKAGVGR